MSKERESLRSEVIQNIVSAAIDFDNAMEQLKTIARDTSCLHEEIVRCKDCKHLYFKDFSAYCPYTVGACRPDGFCNHGEARRGDNYI